MKTFIWRKDGNNNKMYHLLDWHPYVPFLINNIKAKPESVLDFFLRAIEILLLPIKDKIVLLSGIMTLSTWSSEKG